ncbi:MAG: polysaccharide pyruvyl transferase family protein, partial [Gammaproteobacteria bacterium]
DNKVIAAINQTVDLGRSPAKEKALVTVYNKLPFVSVREPVSLDYVRSAGLTNARLVPDAVYGLPKLTDEEIASITKSYDLPDKFVAVTGSSALKRNRHSLRRAASLLQAIQSITGLDIVFLANAKTDIWVADRLSGRFGFITIKPPVRHRDASAIIASAQLMIGGRQHPNIFAFIYHVPYIPLPGNTHKNDGVARLQKYPIAPLAWDCTIRQLEDACNVATRLRTDWTLPEIRIDNYRIFG